MKTINLNGYFHFDIFCSVRGFSGINRVGRYSSYVWLRFKFRCSGGYDTMRTISIVLELQWYSKTTISDIISYYSCYSSYIGQSSIDVFLPSVGRELNGPKRFEWDGNVSGIIEPLRYSDRSGETRKNIARVDFSGHAKLCENIRYFIRQNRKPSVNRSRPRKVIFDWLPIIFPTNVSEK